MYRSVGHVKPLRNFRPEYIFGEWKAPNVFSGMGEGALNGSFGRGVMPTRLNTLNLFQTKKKETSLGYPA